MSASGKDGPPNSIEWTKSIYNESDSSGSAMVS